MSKNNLLISKNQPLLNDHSSNNLLLHSSCVRQYFSNYEKRRVKSFLKTAQLRCFKPVRRARLAASKPKSVFCNLQQTNETKFGRRCQKVCCPAAAEKHFRALLSSDFDDKCLRKLIESKIAFTNGANCVKSDGIN